MGTNNTIFLEVIEWFDESGKELVHRIPEQGSGEIKWGAQLTVRESQQAVFFYNGQAQDTFSTGRHTLETANLPILNKIMSIPWGMTSPLRAEVYICNMKVFPNLTWGTRDPVAFRDSELGLIRLRAFGMFNMQISDPRLFINSLVGTQGIFTEEEIGDYLNRVIVSRFNDFMGQKLDSIFNLPARYHELSEELKGLIADEFSQYGLKLLELFINSITPPPDVQKAIDDKSKLGVFDDLNKLLQMKAAMALESAAQNPGQAGAGIGMGMGVMMPGMIADALKTQTQQAAPAASVPGVPCASCRQITPAGAKFCPNCGQPISAQLRCSRCGADLTLGAKFCMQCGQLIA